MKFQTLVSSERCHTKLAGNEAIEIILQGEGGVYFGTLRFTIGQDPDGDEGDQAYLLKHVDNDDVFTWLPINQGRKSENQAGDCSNCGEQFASLHRMKAKGGDEIRFCQDCYDGVS